MTATGSTKASLDSKVPDNTGITPAVAADMWHQLGSEHVAIVVFEVAQRTEPADGNDADPSLKLRVLNLELARDTDEAEYLRTILRGLYRLRTKADTLDGQSTDAADTIASARGTLTGLLIEHAEQQGWTVTLTAHGPIIDIPGVDGDAARYLRRAIELVIHNQHAALATITRKLKISAPLATVILDLLEARGIVGPADELHNRDVLVTVDQLPEILTELDGEADDTDSEPEDAEQDGVDTEAVVDEELVDA